MGVSSWAQGIFTTFMQCKTIKTTLQIVLLIAYWIATIIPVSLGITTTFFTVVTLVQGFTIVVDEGRKEVIINMSADILRMTFEVFLAAVLFSSILAAYWTYGLVKTKGLFGLHILKKDKDKEKTHLLEDRMKKVESILGIKDNGDGKGE